MIKQYRKKPVVIEAVQWTGNRDEIMEFVGERALGWNPVGYIVLIATPDGRKAVNYKDYIIKDEDGEFYPCKPDIFEREYEEVKS